MNFKLILMTCAIVLASTSGAYAGDHQTSLTKEVERKNNDPLLALLKADSEYNKCNSVAEEKWQKCWNPLNWKKCKKTEAESLWKCLMDFKTECRRALIELQKNSKN